MARNVALAVLAAVSALAAPASAVPLRYTISGFDTLKENQVEFASFQVDSNPVPDGTAEGIGFFVASVPGTYTYGATTTTEPQDITFYLDAAHGYDDPTTDPGGLYVGEADLLGFRGPQLFSGPIDHPTLLTGTFTLFDDFSGSPISLTVLAVPEPATWTSMAAGLGLAGAALRRRGTRRDRRAVRDGDVTRDIEGVA